MGNTSTRTDAKPIPSVFCIIVLFATLINFCGCSDFWEPVESTPEPTEYSYNYWLLDRTFLFRDELKGIPAEGDSVTDLYKAVKSIDPFTRYYPPSNSESASIAINTSIVRGDVGMEYYLKPSQNHPLCVFRVYPESPAGRAGVPRHSCIEKINGTELKHDPADPSNARRVNTVYDSILVRNKNISLTLLVGPDTLPSSPPDTLRLEMTKEDVYAPTIFIDTIFTDDQHGTTVVTITEFKQTTANKTLGTFGELKAYLDSTQNSREPRLLDLRGNPGGHVSQCVAMADLFVKSGIISTRSWRTFKPDGTSTQKFNSTVAVPGDAGEGHDFMVLVNGGSASCAEIFTAAIAEGAGIPVVGSTTYGKGIGQTTWSTPASGLAVITNLEFLTPKGNSYHKKGIVPEIQCGSEPALTCGINALQKRYGKQSAKKKVTQILEEEIIPIRKSFPVEGAFIENEGLEK